ncbi:class I SAM-dependent methyltransferase [Candidatus Saccharibacteria bacterium]|nr:class I SAM-dependent methyltransferase [Candidatus Saccharibacteria bacterium]
MSWKNDQVSRAETEKIIGLAKSVLDVEGDFVELGCYKGDTSLLLAEVVYEYNRGLLVEKSVDKVVEEVWKSGGKDVEETTGEKVRKRLWIYDSFEGLPEKRLEDESVLGEAFRAGELGVTKREVKERFLRAGLPVPVIKKGWFADLTGDEMPEKIALAFLDGDFYESIRDSLRLVASRISSGGVLIVHDYTNPALPGVKKAVDEWLKRQNVDYQIVLL